MYDRVEQRPVGLVLLDQIAQCLFTDYRKQNVPDYTLRVFYGSLSKFEEDGCLASYAPEVIEQLSFDFVLCSDADVVYGLNKQIHQAIDYLAAALPTISRRQGVPHRLDTQSQLARRLRRHPPTKPVDDLRCDVIQKSRRQAQPIDALKFLNLLRNAIDTRAPGVRFERRERQSIIAPCIVVIAFF
ncbi:MAG: hypothetical protein ABT17_11265 [Rhodanobacter sp. SCN 69-32]|nr:MAG: hypothetical protein ABT17_11265 [Rhodanobacter sp. SCN 69-32]